MKIGESFWVIPAIALLVAAALAIALLMVDMEVSEDLTERYPQMFGAGAEGARGILSTIASSMITVAGVVFSVTTVALSLAANTYSPRVLRTFMHDRPTQATFGILVGIFVYCLVVLRTVRSSDEGGGFVPSLALLGAIVLAMCGVLALVYFIHHVTAMIQAPSILQRISDETRAAIENIFPDQLGYGQDDGEGQIDLDAVESRQWRGLPARRSGYIQSVQTDRLLEFARSRRAVLRMELEVGQFAVEAHTLVSIASEGVITEEDARELEGLFVMASERTIEQDVGFGLQQIVSVGVRALSSGINDPSTAMMCIDHLSALFVRLAQRRIPGRLRTLDGELRVIAKGQDFESLAALAFEPMTRYAAGRTEVLVALARAAHVVSQAASPQRRLIMRRHINAIELAQRD